MVRVQGVGSNFLESRVINTSNNFKVTIKKRYSSLMLRISGVWRLLGLGTIDYQRSSLG